MLKYYGVFEKQIIPLPPEPEFSHFYQPLGGQKMVNYYFIQWAQVGQHMLITNT